MFSIDLTYFCAENFVRNPLTGRLCFCFFAKGVWKCFVWKSIDLYIDLLVRTIVLATSTRLYYIYGSILYLSTVPSAGEDKMEKWRAPGAFFVCSRQLLMDAARRFIIDSVYPAGTSWCFEGGLGIKYYQTIC